MTLPGTVAACRICLVGHGSLCEPCACKGSIAYVHDRCLTTWRLSFKAGHAKRDHCELCHAPYRWKVRRQDKLMLFSLLLGIGSNICVASTVVRGCKPKWWMDTASNHIIYDQNYQQWNQPLQTSYCSLQSFLTFLSAMTMQTTYCLMEEHRRQFWAGFLKALALSTCTFLLFIMTDVMHVYLPILSVVYTAMNVICFLKEWCY